MRSNSSRRSAFSLVEIMTVVGIIAFLAAIAVPNMLRSRAKAQAAVCIDNLRQLDSAKAQWAFEFKKVDTDTLSMSDLTPYLRNGVMLVCPANGAYAVTVVSESPSCTVAGHTL